MSEEMYVFVRRWPLLEFDELEVSPYDFQILTSIKGFYLVLFFRELKNVPNAKLNKYKVISMFISILS